MQNSFDSNKYGLAIHTSSPELGLALSNFAGDSRSQTWNLGRDLSTHLHQHLVEFIQPTTWKDLAFIAVAKGPGSFTGTRIGVVTARTLAQQLDIPLFAISTLAAVAWSHPPQPPRTPGGLPPHTQLRSNIVVETDAGTRGRGDAVKMNVLRMNATWYQPPLDQGGLRGGSSESGAIALQMPAQRGQLFTAIYQVSPDNSGLTQLLPDKVMTPEEWQQTLETWQTPYQLIDIPAGAGMGASVSSLLELAYLDWLQGKRPHWSEALPFYGQHPVEDKAVG